MEFSADMQIIEFDSFETAFPVPPDRLDAEKRRFMTLFARDDAASHVGGTSYVCKVRTFLGETFACKRLLAANGVPKGVYLTPEDTARITQGHIDAFYEEYRNQLLVSRMRGFPRVYGFGMIGEDPAIVMEWVEGSSVRDVMRQRDRAGEPLSAAAIAALGDAVLEVLESAGRLDNTLVHRDISPANIMVRTGERDVDEQIALGAFDVCLIDFGSASAHDPIEASFTMAEQVWRNGTPEYAPPEMLTRDIPHVDELRKSQAIDVFALCSVMYELYAGHTPWRVGEHPELSPYRLKMERAPERLNPRSPEDAALVEAVIGGLALDQGARPTVPELRAALGMASGNESPVTFGSGEALQPGFRDESGQRFVATGSGEGGGRAGEAIAPVSPSRPLLSRRALVVGGVLLAVAAVGGAAAARSCQPQAAYDFSSYPKASATYAGDAFVPAMRLSESAWILRNLESGSEVALDLSGREPGRFVDGLMRAFDAASGSYGFITPSDDGSSVAWRVLPAFPEAGDFSAVADVRLAAARDGRSGLWGYIDEDGAFALRPGYSEARRFSHGYAAVRLEGSDRWSLVDEQGVQVIEPRFLDLGLCSGEGLLAASEQSGAQWGFVDSGGAWVIPDEYRQVRRFSEGLAACRVDGGLWGFVDVAGETAIEARFADARAFEGGVAPVQDEETRLWGLIDPKGEWQVEPCYLALGDRMGGLFPAHGSPANVYDIERSDKRAWREYTQANGDWTFGYGYITAKGEWAVKPIYGDTLIRQAEQ